MPRPHCQHLDTKLRRKGCSSVRVRKVPAGDDNLIDGVTKRGVSLGEGETLVMSKLLAPSLATGLKVRYPGLANTRRETLRKEKAAEEQGGVDGVACERVPNEGHAGKVARREACARAWVAVQKSPHAEVGDQEKLQSAEERGSSDAQKTTILLQEAADHHAEEKTCVHQRAQPVETDDDVRGEHHQHGKQKCQAAVAHHGA